MKPKAITDVLIIGAGPTGLMLACLCAQRGLTCRVLESRTAPGQHSRSIGIHPPSLELFDHIGVIHDLLKAGTRIQQGIASVGKRQVGVINFDTLPGRYPFVLTVSQAITETLLEHRLQELLGDVIDRGVTVKAVRADDSVATVETNTGTEFAAHWVVGCDGKRSVCRESIGMGGTARLYPDQYVMGDFVDQSRSRSQALIFLCREGLIESFPHSQNLRRWVVHLGMTPSDAPSEGHIREVIRQRIGEDISGECVMLSRFQPDYFLADTFVRGRCLLAGDSAHVLSPIGGQGMNLGWLDAAAAVEAISRGDDTALQAYDAVRRARFVRAAKQAEFNMRRGRPFRSEEVQILLVRLLLSPLLHNRLRDRFTMQGLAG